MLIKLFFLFFLEVINCKFVRKDLPPRGYISRACGFSRGYSSCDICNGNALSDDQHEIYIDCDSGADTIDCGDPATPCLTISFAFSDRNEAEKQNIFCFRGICTGESWIAPSLDGIVESNLVEMSGSESYDFEYPAKPFMLVGWDSNGNGEFPPYDTADVAVLDGNGLDRVFGNFANSYIEIAHFTVRNYGTYTTEVNTGFWKASSGSNLLLTNIYFHDIVLEDVNRERTMDSSTNVFNWFGGAVHKYIAFENFKLDHVSSYMSRGSAALTKDAPNRDGPIRFQNFQFLGHADDGTSGGYPEGSLTLFKMWGYFEAFEVLDSVWDSGVPNVWLSDPKGHTNGVALNICSQNGVVRNNHFISFSLAMSTYPFSGTQSYACWDRPTSNHTFDHNLIELNAEHFQFGGFGMIINGGEGAPKEALIGDMQVTNNIFESTVGWQSAIRYDGGNDNIIPPGLIKVTDNTIRGGPYRYDNGGWTIGGLDNDNFKYYHERFLVVGNRIEQINLTPGLQYRNSLSNYYFSKQPSLFKSDYNIFDSCGTFRMTNDEEKEFEDYQTITGFDEHSKVCGECSSETDCLDLEIPEEAYDRPPPVPNIHGGVNAAGIVLGILLPLIFLVLIIVIIVVIIIFVVFVVKKNKDN